MELLTIFYCKQQLHGKGGMINGEEVGLNFLLSCHSCFLGPFLDQTGQHFQLYVWKLWAHFFCCLAGSSLGRIICTRTAYRSKWLDLFSPYNMVQIQIRTSSVAAFQGRKKFQHIIPNSSRKHFYHLWQFHVLRLCNICTVAIDMRPFLALGYSKKITINAWGVFKYKGL